MEKVFNYINNNAILASFITLIISTTINVLVQVLFKKSDRKYNKTQENEREKKKQLENKAELVIENNIIEDISIQCIEILISDFKAVVSKDKKDVEFYYPKNILSKEKYKHLIFYIKNIGNANINQLDVCVASQKNVMLCDANNVEIYVKNKLINYNSIYDRKILKQEIIKIDIAYLEGSKIFSPFGSELELLFKDSYGNLYAQPFFIQQKNLYEPRNISSKEYKKYISTDIAIKCFKNPYMW